MVQIHSDQTKQACEYLNITMDHEGFNFMKAKEIAKIKARERCDHPMILSWKNGKTGEFYPNYECGKENKPFWIRYAEGRGVNLVVDFNKGEYVFMILMV
ncbi:MAG: hypothetical protein GY729_12760 [Desulfobacteraceae bacterium]|nr:hypothetical protein [Desulfobacteraceae bacterium]